MTYDELDTPTVPGGDTPAPEVQAEQINDWASLEWHNGNSYYVLTHPQTGEQERFIRVTSPLEPVAKSALIPWASGLAAKATYAELPRVVNSLLVPDCGRSYNRCEHDYGERCDGCPCLDCPTCMAKFLADRHLAENYRRSDEGTRFHQLARRWIMTGETGEYQSDLEPYVATFRRFITDFGLTPESFEWAEAIVVNRTHGYAGTCDAGLWLRRGQSKLADDQLDRLTADGQPRLTSAKILGDWKTREAEGRRPFQDMALQLTGYRYAEFMRMPDGSEVPMPEVDATAVFQIRPDGHDMIFTLSDPVEELEGFLGYLQGHRWQLERGAASVSSRTFKYAPSVARARANDAAKTRRAAKKAAQPEQTKPVTDRETSILGRPADELISPEPPF